MAWMMAMVMAAPAGVVIRSVANIHSTPSEDAEVVSQAIYATTVGVVDEEQGWLKVRTADDYTGWMSASSLRRLSEGERPYASTGKAARIQSLFANLYREPSVTGRQPLLTVPYETRLEAVGETDAENHRWIQIRLPDDRPAFVQQGDVTFEQSPASIDEAIALGKRFVGIPYLWGGVSSYGLDCSGFMQLLCRRRGFGLPRDARPQSRWTGSAPVERTELKPGDLLYFGPSPEKVNHTGMYIGSGQFIHATATDHPMVQISRLDDHPWTRLFVSARRVK